MKILDKWIQDNDFYILIEIITVKWRQFFRLWIQKKAG
jgi:hypothetical protein